MAHRPAVRRTSARLSKSVAQKKCPAETIAAYRQRVAEERERAMLERTRQFAALFASDPGYQVLWASSSSEVQLPNISYDGLNRRATAQADALLCTLEQLLMHPTTLTHIGHLTAIATTHEPDERFDPALMQYLDDARKHTRSTMRRVSRVATALQQDQDPHQFAVLHALGVPTIRYPDEQ